MADNNTPNQSANKSKAEGERWSSDDTSATKAAERSQVSSNYQDTDDDAGGITNRSYNEERENQEALPTRGTSRDESRNLGVGDEVEMDREERRSER
jgi:hypothetical protein